jgi:hypothetical protein
MRRVAYQAAHLDPATLAQSWTLLYRGFAYRWVAHPRIAAPIGQFRRRQFGDAAHYRPAPQPLRARAGPRG